MVGLEAALAEDTRVQEHLIRLMVLISNHIGIVAVCKHPDRR